MAAVLGRAATKLRAPLFEEQDQLATLGMFGLVLVGLHTTGIKHGHVLPEDVQLYVHAVRRVSMLGDNDSLAPALVDESMPSMKPALQAGHAAEQALPHVLDLVDVFM